MAKLTLSNYRCFAESDPATIEIADGFTAIVGPNNAGKSALLRFLVEGRSVLDVIRQNIGPFILGNPLNAGWSSVRDPFEVIWNGGRGEIRVSIEVPGKSEVWKEWQRLTFAVARDTQAMRLVEFNGLELGKLGRPSTVVHRGLNGELGRAGTHINVNYHGGYRPSSEVVGDIQPFVDELSSLIRALYVPASRNALVSGGTGMDYDIQVGQGFVESWSRIQAGPTKATQYKARDITEDIRRLLGFGTLHIQADTDKKRLLLEIDGHPFGLEEVGSGIAHLIVTLINVAIREQDFILIDEPEMGLHPSLQVEFLLALARHAKRGVVFATHSMGLARAVADRIYSVQRLPGGNSVVQCMKGDPGLMERLGETQYRLCREMGYSTVLLVEGSTDLTVFKEFLRLLGLDRRVVLLSLGGSDVIKAAAEGPLSEIKSACEHVIAVIDSDKQSAEAAPAAKAVGFRSVCEKVGIRCHITKLRATENYLTDAAIKEALGTHRSQLGPFEDIKKAPSAWPKSLSCKAAARMTVDDVKNTDIGEFLLEQCGHGKAAQ